MSADKATFMELQDESLIKQVGNVDFATEPVLFCVNTGVVRKGKRRPRVLLCTHYNLYVYKKKFHKGLIPSTQAKLGNITSMSSADPTQLQLLFKSEDMQELTISDDSTVEMARALVEHFMDVYWERHRPTMNVIRQASDGLRESPDAFLKCVKFQAMLKNTPLSERFATSLEMLMARVMIREAVCEDLTMDLGELDDAEKYQEFLFYALAKCRSFTKLVIPAWSASSWEKVAACVKMSKRLKQLESALAIEKTFDTFVNDVKTNPRLSLNTFVLSGKNYTPTAIGKVVSMVQACPTIAKIRITSGLETNAFEWLVDQLSHLGQVKYLELDRLANMPIQAISPIAQNMKAMSLTNCGIDVYDLLEQLSLEKVKILQIDASGNFSRKPLSSDMPVPPTVASYVMREIEWESGNLATFMEITGKHRYKWLKIDISGAKMSDHDWLKFDDFMGSHSNRSLTHFVYDNNRMSASVVSFMKACPSLTCVWMQGSLDKGDDCVPVFCEYLKTCTTLRTLHITGSLKTRLGSSLKQILTTLKSSRSLQFLDIGDHGIGHDLLPMLLDFFETNQSVTELMLDGNNILDLKGLEEFVAKLRKRNYRLQLHVPENDLCKMAELQGVPREKVTEIVAAINELQECTRVFPFSAAPRADETGENVDNTPECLRGMQSFYVDDGIWEESLNIGRLGSQDFHYQRVDKHFNLKLLIRKVRST